MIRRQNSTAVLSLTAIVAFMLLAAAVLTAASPVAGVWQVVSLTPDGDEMHGTLTLTEPDGKLSATFVADDGDWKVSNVKLADNVLSFTVSREDEYNVSLKVAGDKMEGTWSGGGDSGKVTATRKKA